MIELSVMERAQAYLLECVSPGKTARAHTNCKAVLFGVWRALRSSAVGTSQMACMRTSQQARFHGTSCPRARPAANASRCETSIEFCEPLRKCALVASGTLLAFGLRSAALAADFTSLSKDVYLADMAKIVPSATRESLSDRLAKLESDTGYRVRIITKTNIDKGTLDSARAVWGVDSKTVLLQFDPTSPNIFGYDYIGDEVLFGVLRRPFWIELQSRYGNMFYVRDNGEAEAVASVVAAVDECLHKGGCRVVPGLPEEQYYFTLITSIAGGVIFGFSSRLPTNDRVRRQWVWTLLFAPLWGSLFISFGLGPITSRTDDKWLLAANTAAFLVAALLFKPSPFFPTEKADDAI